jgi:histone H3/H4
LDEETADLRALIEARRQSGVDVGEETEITDGEPTFLFRIPERSRLSLAQPVPRTPDGQTADDDAEDYEDVEDEEDAVEGAEVEYDDEDGDDPLQDNGLDVEDEPLRQASVPLADDEQVQARSATTVKTKAPYKRLPREVKLSRFGIEYPSFPPAVVKRMANTFSKQYGGSGKLSKDTLASIQQASDWFFEQISEDVADYATHAGRKTIEESDVVTLMKR